MNQKKYRNEIKYLCSEAQLAQIENRIKELSCLDIHAGRDGTYLVTSLYFDDYANSCYYENENGVDPREKYRVRIYDRNLSHIALECKQKRAGMTCKTFCSISTEQCEAILHQVPLRWEVSQEPLLNQFLLLWQTRMLRPKVIVEYQRTAYTYQLGNVRITFDRNITASAQIDKFGQMDLCVPVMPAGQHILEIKYDELIPDFIYNAAGIEMLRYTAFSKYYICRRSINI